MKKYYSEKYRCDNYYSEKYGYDPEYGYGTSYYDFYVGGPVPEEVVRDREIEMKKFLDEKLRKFWLEDEECKRRQKAIMEFGNKYLKKLGRVKISQLKEYLWKLAKIDIEIDEKNNVIFKNKKKRNEKDEYEKFDFFVELNKLIFSIENGIEYKEINNYSIIDGKE